MSDHSQDSSARRLSIAESIMTKREFMSKVKFRDLFKVMYRISKSKCIALGIFVRDGFGGRRVFLNPSDLTIGDAWDMTMANSLGFREHGRQPVSFDRFSSSLEDELVGDAEGSTETAERINMSLFVMGPDKDKVVLSCIVY